MAQRRAIEADIWGDEFFGSQLNFLEKLLWIGLFSKCADDQGRLMDNAIVIRSMVFPYDDVRVDEIQAGLAKFASSDPTDPEGPSILRYQAGGKGYIQLLKWWKHQPLQWAIPSRYPAPPGWKDRIRSNIRGRYLEENWPKRAHLDPPPGQPTYLDHLAFPGADPTLTIQGGLLPKRDTAGKLPFIIVDPDVSIEIEPQNGKNTHNEPELDQERDVLLDPPGQSTWTPQVEALNPNPNPNPNPEALESSSSSSGPPGQGGEAEAVKTPKELLLKAAGVKRSEIRQLMARPLISFDDVLAALAYVYREANKIRYPHALLGKSLLAGNLPAATYYNRPELVPREILEKAGLSHMLPSTPPPEPDPPPAPPFDYGETPADRAWRSILQQVEPGLSKATRETYVDPIRVVELTGSELTLQVPTGYLKTWLDDRLKVTCDRALIGILNRAEARVKFVTEVK